MISDEKKTKSKKEAQHIRDIDVLLSSVQPLDYLELFDPDSQRPIAVATSSSAAAPDLFAAASDAKGARDASEESDDEASHRKRLIELGALTAAGQQPKAIDLQEDERSDLDESESDSHAPASADSVVEAALMAAIEAAGAEGVATNAVHRLCGSAKPRQLQRVLNHMCNRERIVRVRDYHRPRSRSIPSIRMAHPLTR